MKNKGVKVGVDSEYPVTLQLAFDIGYDGAGGVIEPGLGDGVKGVYTVWVPIGELRDRGERVKQPLVF